MKLRSVGCTDDGDNGGEVGKHFRQCLRPGIEAEVIFLSPSCSSQVIEVAQRVEDRNLMIKAIRKREKS